MASVTRTALTQYLNELLKPEGFKDYCPNGLQVEGRADVQRIVCGVTACQALIDAAVERRADAVLVHHGWFWKSEDGRVTGYRRQRMASLLAADLNLFAYHLPLDAHPELGNNAELARRLGWSVSGRFGDQDIGFIGEPAAPGSAESIARQIEQVVGRKVSLLGQPQATVRRVAWCSGGAQGYLEAAIAAGAELFVTGELSEPCFHIAAETGVACIGAGHHATERYGIQALGAHLAARWGLSCEFVDIDNPV